jgi:hypothetical protein
MEQWGFSCSIYIPKAKIWILFSNSDDIRQKVEKINNDFQEEYIVYSDYFCDYWK